MSLAPPYNQLHPYSSAFYKLYDLEIGAGRAQEGTAATEEAERNRVVEKVFSYYFLLVLEKYISHKAMTVIGCEHPEYREVKVIENTQDRTISRIHVLVLSLMDECSPVIIDLGGIGGTIVYSQEGAANEVKRKLQISEPPLSLKFALVETAEGKVTHIQLGETPQNHFPIAPSDYKGVLDQAAIGKMLGYIQEAGQLAGDHFKKDEHLPKAARGDATQYQAVVHSMAEDSMTQFQDEMTPARRRDELPVGAQEMPLDLEEDLLLGQLPTGESPLL
jgi:hypothetical protein